MNQLFWTFILYLTTLLVCVYGHGRLMVPPARNSMWRRGWRNPVNYNDNELFCGGFVVQYEKNGGHCGVCGDNYKDKVPRNHEAGGLYGNGINTRTYVSGQIITIEADLTTNHKGYMEVKLCPHDSPKDIITQECLDQYPLKVEGTNGFQFIIPMDTKKTEYFTWKVELPEGIICSDCVIQWKYFTGNTWGTDMTGTTGVGKGPQETFVNCADVRIISQSGGGFPVASNIIQNPWTLYYRGEFPGVIKDTSPHKPGGLIPLVIRSQLCIPINEHKGIPGMDKWCMDNCMKYPPSCHPEVCRCVHECDAIGSFAKEEGADIFCHQHCLKYPSFCPEDRCYCY